MTEAAARKEEQFNVDEAVALYVELRDRKKQLEDKHKEQVKPYVEAMEKLEVRMLKFLQDTSQESAATVHGTVYQTVKKSSPIADMDAFRAHVIETRDWNLVDWRANVSAVEDFVTEHSTLPPGVNFRMFQTVGIRRK